MRSNSQIWYAMAAIFVIGVFLAVLGGIQDSHSQIWLEIGKSGLQLSVVAVLGGSVGFLWKRIDQLRRERDQRDAHQLEILREVIEAYNRIKSARRFLRALGFRPAQGGTLTSDQVTGFEAQLASLNAAQLSLERIKREVEAQPSLFPEPAHILCSLKKVEKYVHEVVEDWEDHGESISAGASKQGLECLKNLTKFLGSSKQGFREHAADPMETLEKAIRKQLSS